MSFYVGFRAFNKFYLVGPGGKGFITATAAACWLANTAAIKKISKFKIPSNYLKKLLYNKKRLTSFFFNLTFLF